jgi:hypothetical protein
MPHSDMNSIIRSAFGRVTTPPPPPPVTRSDAGAGAGQAGITPPPDMNGMIRAFAVRGSGPLWAGPDRTRAV